MTVGAGEVVRRGQIADISHKEGQKVIDSLDAGCVRKRGVKNDSKVFSHLSISKNKVAID